MMCCVTLTSATVEVQVLDVARSGHAGVAPEPVEAAEPRDGPVEDLVGGGRVGEVGDEALDLAPGGRDLGDELLKGGGVAVDGGHGRPLPREQLHPGPAHARGRRGDHDLPVGQTHCFDSLVGLHW